MTTSISQIFTIGHSNLSIVDFIKLLKQHGIEIVCDVRSQPYSKYASHFNIMELRNALLSYNIKYIYLGRELGARSDDPTHYIDGKVQYHLLEQSALFKKGIERIVEGCKLYTIALMCAEKDPINCHRAILICKNLPKEISINHILIDGTLESHQSMEHRLVLKHFGSISTLFNTYEELLNEAYRLQAQKIAFEKEENWE